MVGTWNFCAPSCEVNYSSSYAAENDHATRKGTHPTPHDNQWEVAADLFSLSFLTPGERDMAAARPISIEGTSDRHQAPEQVRSVADTKGTYRDLGIFHKLSCSLRRHTCSLTEMLPMRPCWEPEGTGDLLFAVAALCCCYVVVVPCSRRHIKPASE